MKRIEAIRQIAALLPADALVVASTGRVGRMLFTEADRDTHFTLLGGSGLASPVGLGLALQRPDRTVVVLDGDSSVLMNLGGLANVADQGPAGYFHIVIDNGVYGATGGQRTISDEVALEEIAWACGYNRAERVDDAPALEATLKALFDEPGPAMLLVEVEPEDAPGSVPPIPLSPAALAARFRAAVARPAAADKTP